MKKLFLGLIALTSLGSLQAADPSLTDTTTFVLESGMKVAITITNNVEDTIVAALTAITAIAFARHYFLEYLDNKNLKAQTQLERERKQQEELKQLNELEQQLITYNQRREYLQNQIQKRKESITIINGLLTNHNMSSGDRRAFLTTCLENAQSDLQYWHNELAKLTGTQLDQ